MIGLNRKAILDPSCLHRNMPTLLNLATVSCLAHSHHHRRARPTCAVECKPGADTLASAARPRPRLHPLRHPISTVVDPSSSCEARRSNEEFDAVSIAAIFLQPKC